MTGVEDGRAGVLEPLGAVPEVLDSSRPGHIQHADGLPTQRHLIDEAEAAVEQHRLPQAQGHQRDQLEARGTAQTAGLAGRAGWHVEYRRGYVRFDGQQESAIHAAEALSQVVDHAGVKIPPAVAIEVEAFANCMHQLHVIDGRLPQAIANDNRCAGGHNHTAFKGVDAAAAIEVSATAGRGNFDDAAGLGK